MKKCIKILVLIIMSMSAQAISAQHTRVSNLEEHIKKIYPYGVPKKIIIEPEVKIFEKYKNSDYLDSVEADTITIEIEEVDIKNGKIGGVVFTHPAAGDYYVTYHDSYAAFIKCNNHGLAEEVNTVMLYTIMGTDDEAIEKQQRIDFNQEKYFYDNSLCLESKCITYAPEEDQPNELPRQSYKDGCITDSYVDADGPHITKFCYTMNDVTNAQNTFCEVPEKQFKKFYADKFWKEYANTNPIQEYYNNGFIILDDGKDIYLALAGLLGKPNRKLPIAVYSHYHGGEHTETREIFKWTLNEKGLPVKCEIHQYTYFSDGELLSITHQTTKYIYD